MSTKTKASCAICSTRRFRRSCSGLGKGICAQCCGASREVTVSCPLDCPYLRDARQHERPPEPDLAKLPNQDVEITESFAARNSGLFNFLCAVILKHSAGLQGLVDNDLREALDSLARTYRTLESGLIYETRPANLVAAELQQRLHAELEGFRKHVKEDAGMETVRDADVLGALVMLQRMEFGRNNGRQRGRAFIDFLFQEFPEAAGAASPASGSSVIIP
jgi:hypothetical protein